MNAPVILVDADACPVKEEVYRVAWRHDVPVKIVSNSRLRVPEHPLVERVLVSDGFDAADDWIAEAATPRSVVITADILLADRALKAGAVVLAPTGKAFTAASIGPAIDARHHGRLARRNGGGHRRPATLLQGRSFAILAATRRRARTPQAPILNFFPANSKPCEISLG